MFRIVFHFDGNEVFLIWKIENGKNSSRIRRKKNFQFWKQTIDLFSVTTMQFNHWIGETQPNRS